MRLPVLGAHTQAEKAGLVLKKQSECSCGGVLDPFYLPDWVKFGPFTWVLTRGVSWCF